MPGDEQSNALLPITKYSAALERRVGRALHDDRLTRHRTNGLVGQREDLRRADVMPSCRRDFGYTVLDTSLIEVMDQVSAALRIGSDPEAPICQVSAEGRNIA